VFSVKDFWHSLSLYKLGGVASRFAAIFKVDFPMPSAVFPSLMAAGRQLQHSATARRLCDRIDDKDEN
jgi:hypothetical protein